MKAVDRWLAGNTCKGYVYLFWGGLIDNLGQGRLVQGEIIAALDVGVVKGNCHWSFWYIAQQILPLSLQHRLWAVRPCC